MHFTCDIPAAELSYFTPIYCIPLYLSVLKQNNFMCAYRPPSEYPEQMSFLLLMPVLKILYPNKQSATFNLILCPACVFTVDYRQKSQQVCNYVAPKTVQADQQVCVLFVLCIVSLHKCSLL